ncbi:MAG: phosphoribosylglycinamide formyltransferase [Clostridiales bacterium]|nr:phosphoribosylglycinamide formyltransferase [Clostridiales bacterium]
MKNIAVLISGGGSNLQSLIDSVESGKIKARISVVISSRKGVYGLERAKRHNIPAYCIQKRDFLNDKDFDKALLEKLKEYEIDLVVLAGYLNILSPQIIAEYENRIINIHPSLIPSFCGKGYYGARVHQAVIDYGVKITGVTVHFVDEGADTGPIILQKAVDVKDYDNADSLAERVLNIEHEILPKAVALFVEDRLLVDGRVVRIIEN